jgi:serine/threonine protein kinase
MADAAMERGSRYAMVRVLGEGSQAVTYEATDMQTGQSVAIKRFDLRNARAWKEVELAEREARVLSTLQHPLLPRYVDHYERSGGFHLVMERVEGETLDARLRRKGALSENEVWGFLHCAREALAYLHRRPSPIVHRDVKPSNVVRRASDGAYVIVDFGSVSERFQRASGGSTVVGTLGYMAPEQVHGAALPQTDVYAVGATALAALAGVEADHFQRAGLGVDVRATLAARGRTASPALIPALEQMLEPDPRRRPTSVGAAWRAPVSAPVVQGIDDRAAAKSIRKLLWVLLLPMWMLFSSLGALGFEVLPPVLMMLSIVFLTIIGWEDATLIQLALKRRRERLAAPRTRVSTPPRELRARVATASWEDELEPQLEARAMSV